MTPIYWIPTSTAGRLGIMSRPRGGDWLVDEIRSLASSKVDTLVRLLTSTEMEELDLSLQARYCRDCGIELIDFPIPDRSTPNLESTLLLTRDLANRIRASKTIVAHCRQGIGRAGMVTAATLMILGSDVKNAITQVSLARGIDVPETKEQKQWLVRFEQAMR